jgi:hypothetical protein
MGAAPVGVDREAEAEGGVADLVDDPVGPDVEELDALELATAGFALEDRVLEQRLLHLGLVGLLPPDRCHSSQPSEHQFAMLTARAGTRPPGADLRPEVVVEAGGGGELAVGVRVRCRYSHCCAPPG